MPDQAPIASPRFSAGNTSASSVSVSGVTIAAPAPWIARAAISAAVRGRERRARPRPAVNIASPITNMRRRPNRSPSAAPVSSRTAYDSVYALTVHSSDWIGGAEVGADGRQCGGDDQVVEHDHEQRDRHDRERPTRATILL